MINLILLLAKSHTDKSKCTFSQLNFQKKRKKAIKTVILFAQYSIFVN